MEDTDQEMKGKIKESEARFKKGRDNQDLPLKTLTFLFYIWTTFVTIEG